VNLSDGSRIGDDPPTSYHHWYYDNRVWERTSWLGVRTLKSVSDMWNYQEILTELRPSVVVEFGTANGGSALFFATVLQQLETPFRLLTVDVDVAHIDQRAMNHPAIEVLESSSTDPGVARRIFELRAELPGPVFSILDSDHSRDHVYAELELLTPLLEKGDYVVVEDANINGHPVLPGWGPGPFEAVADFLEAFPGTYRCDGERETKFGFTFATSGFLVRS